MIIIHAGVAQRERQEASLPGDTGIESGSRSTMLQAIAVGLLREASAYEAGWRHGEEGARFQPLGFDAFSYACGFARARQIKGGADALRAG